MRYLLEITSPKGSYEEMVLEKVRLEGRVIYGMKVGTVDDDDGFIPCSPISVIKTAPIFSLSEYDG